MVGQAVYPVHTRSRLLNLDLQRVDLIEVNRDDAVSAVISLRHIQAASGRNPRAVRSGTARTRPRVRNVLGRRPRSIWSFGNQPATIRDRRGISLCQRAIDDVLGRSISDIAKSRKSARGGLLFSVIRQDKSSMTELRSLPASTKLTHSASARRNFDVGIFSAHCSS